MNDPFGTLARQAITANPMQRALESLAPPTTPEVDYFGEQPIGSAGGPPGAMNNPANANLAPVIETQEPAPNPAITPQTTSPVSGTPNPSQPAGPGGTGPTRDMTAYRRAIQGIESGGRYDIVGATHPRLGRALGAYQIMEANIGPWSREALGREVSVDEFLKTPAIQDAIFDYKFGQAMDKYGTPQDAASVWLTGQPYSRMRGSSVADVHGTNADKYVAQFNRYLRDQPNLSGTTGSRGGSPATPGYNPQLAEAKKPDTGSRQRRAGGAGVSGGVQQAQDEGVRVYSTPKDFSAYIAEVRSRIDAAAQRATARRANLPKVSGPSRET